MTIPFLNHYPAAQNRYDEMFEESLFTESLAPRPHWRPLLEQLLHESPDQMHERIESVQRQIRENGVTYNVYADPDGMQRPWDLNVLPFIIPHHEWAQIEASVIQRATLMNRILDDVYGAQRLLSEGLLPAALIHGHAGFLRPCHGIRQSDGVALHFYAVDLARAPNGRWWAVADRTQAPSGAGYALENRIIISRAFPELFRDLKVQHLASFFATLRNSLAHWGRQCADQRGDSAQPVLREGEAPLIVLLTPGPYNETYYEQTFLARYLGFPLVEGSDLTVRNGMVWMKTLSGPQRVHVILRRVDDDFCDPLELRSDSALGVAGLTDAARRGNVLIANGLGANLLESGALLGYLPALCERLLGEKLKMPSVGTWWCGEAAALEDAIERLDSLIIKSAFPQLRQYPIFGEDLDPTAREALVANMRAQPHNYVAQELVRISQAPVLSLARQPALKAAAVGLRVFACATPNGYVVMPGGLTRVATGPDARVITMQRGGASKDTWVQTAGHVNTFSLLHRKTSAQDLVRADGHISSRIVENLFWFGRYTERCDNTARLLRTALDFLLKISPEDRGSEWPTVQAICQYYGLIKSKADDAESSDDLILSDAEIEFELLEAVVSPNGPGLVYNLDQLYQVAGHLRERLSLDNWHTLNRVVQKNAGIEYHSHHPSLSEAITILNETTIALMTLSGFALDGMTRDLGWRFLSIGRRLERLQFMCTTLMHAVAMPEESSLDWLLEIGDSIITYRSRYMAQPEWMPVLDLLVLDDSNPRSIAFQLKGLIQYLQRLESAFGASGEALLAPLAAELKALQPEPDLQNGSATLIDLLQRLNTFSYTLSEQLGQRFFSHTGDINHRSFAA